MYYGQIIKQCITDGVGIRVSLYCSGCRNHCKGCHNPETWSFTFGKKFTEETVQELKEALDKPYIAGLTLCGGDPMEPENQTELVALLKKLKPKSVWIYTGYEWEAVKDSELISLCDVAVTGPFILEKRDISKDNAFRGSTNQELIDIKKSLASCTKVYYTVD